jgi:hypothetical protein
MSDAELNVDLEKEKWGNKMENGFNDMISMNVLGHNDFSFRYSD